MNGDEMFERKATSKKGYSNKSDSHLNGHSRDKSMSEQARLDKNNHHTFLMWLITFGQTPLRPSLIKCGGKIS